MFIGKFTNFLDTALSDTQYKNVVSDWKQFEDDGTNPIRVLVYAVPTILSYIGRKIIWIEDNKLVNLCVNMSIISTGLYVVSMFTSGIFIGRLPIYFSLYNYILLPWEIENLFTERSKKLVYIGLIGFYLLLSDAYDICNVLKEGKSMKPIRILHVVTYMGRGGLETMLMNYYRQIDRNEVQFDFLVHRDFEADYDKEILKLGGKIYHLPRLNPWDYRYLKKLDEFFQQHKEYKIVHSHLDCMAGIPLKYAKKNGIPVRIAHAHSKSQDKDFKYPLKLWMKRMIPRYATKLFACGEEAGEWMFGGLKFNILNNAIDTKQYQYSEKVRTAYREELGLGDSLVIGHVGRFNPPKNHRFLIEIFDKLKQKNTNVKLLLVGDGDGRGKIEDLVKEKNLQEDIKFLGMRDDVYNILQAMDVFVFPSLYEGLPVTLIEAQSAGLPCIISDQVPLECKISDLIHVKSLQENESAWVDEILKQSDYKRTDTTPLVIQSGYDIRKNAEKLQKYYLKLYRETE